MEEKKNNYKVLTVAVLLLMVVAIISVSYAYFSAKITKVNESQTIIKSNELGLIYTGVTDIDITGIVPGDYMRKTFTVENKSNRAVDFNIYMENITNEFNEDLVYTLTGENGEEVLSQRVLPETKSGKTYLKVSIPIDSAAIQHYTMTVKFIYSEDSQNVNQGKSFHGTVGIDTERVTIEEPKERFSDGDIVYFNPTLNQKCDDYVASNSDENNVSGCLKFYTVNHDKDAGTVDLVLDHNASNNLSQDSVKYSTVYSWDSGVNNALRFITIDDYDKLKNDLTGPEFWAGKDYSSYICSSGSCSLISDWYAKSNFRPLFNISTSVLE